MPYKVLIDTLNHNGRLRVPGELIDMNEADAAPLIKIGAIEAANQNDAQKQPDDSDASKTGKKESKTKAK